MIFFVITFAWFGLGIFISVMSDIEIYRYTDVKTFRHVCLNILILGPIPGILFSIEYFAKIFSHSALGKSFKRMVEKNLS